ncbi:MAG: hypothetical protein GXO21_01800 [Aquificae bacterium]|nr:hypothetical protein [Aquificota bacterium]
MGRIRTENIKTLLEEIFIALELDNFDDFDKKMKKFLSISLDSLSQEEAKFIYNKLTELEKKMILKQSLIAKKIQNNTDIRKYLK